MDSYDPLKAPAAGEWLEMDESERIELIARRHSREDAGIANARLHAVIHSVVENQLAAGDRPAVSALARLEKDGLDRHEAVHAIGSVLTEHFYNIMKGGETGPGKEPGMEFSEKLDRLTADKWRNSA